MANMTDIEMHFLGPKETLEQIKDMCEVLWDSEGPRLQSNGYGPPYHIGYMWCNSVFMDGDNKLVVFCETRWNSDPLLNLSHGGNITIIDKGIHKCLPLEDVCIDYHVSCELYLREPGVCFAEHIIVNDVGEVYKDCADYDEENGEPNCIWYKEGEWQWKL